jgi:hypothetical protein
MKKNTIFLKAAGKGAGLLAVLLAFGLILAGCDSKVHDDCNKSGNCYSYDKCDSIRCPANNGELGDCNC